MSKANKEIDIESYLVRTWTADGLPAEIARLQVMASDLQDTVRTNIGKIEMIKQRPSHKDALATVGNGIPSHADVEEAQALQSEIMGLRREIHNCNIVIEFLNKTFAAQVR
jgi:hypothetical protein